MASVFFANHLCKPSRPLYTRCPIKFAILYSWSLYWCLDDPTFHQSLKLAISQVVIDTWCFFRNWTLTCANKKFNPAKNVGTPTCTVSMVCRRTGLPAPASRSLKNVCIRARSLLLEKCPVTELMTSPMVLLLPNREKKWAQCDLRWLHASGPPWKKRLRDPMSPDNAKNQRKGQTKRVSSNRCHDGWHILVLHLPLNTTGKWECWTQLLPAPARESCSDTSPGSTCPCFEPELWAEHPSQRVHSSRCTWNMITDQYEGKGNFRWKIYWGNPPIPPTTYWLNVNPLWGHFEEN